MMKQRLKLWLFILGLVLVVVAAGFALGRILSHRKLGHDTVKSQESKQRTSQPVQDNQPSAVPTPAKP